MRSDRLIGRPPPSIRKVRVVTGSKPDGTTISQLLLVEDDDSHAALIRRTLRSQLPGVEIQRVASLACARERMATDAPDLALVDMRLPDGSGLQLIHHTAIGHLAVPVIIMTGQGCEEIAVEAMRAGALDYVVKTAEGFPGNLPHVVSRALRESQHVHERKRAERTARRVAKRYRALYDDAPAMFFTVDHDGKIVSVNQFGARRMGYSPEELIGRPVTELYPSTEHAGVLGALGTVHQDAGDAHHWELRKRCRDGSTFWARESARAVEDDDGVMRTLMVCEDISDSHELAQQLAYQASHDSLTGLVNRREFERRLARVLRELANKPDDHVLCYIDLDQFKLVNDACGHAAGDELLRQLAVRLRQRVRKRDTLARLGGDEFGLLMEHCSAEQGQRVAESVRDCVSEMRFACEGRSFNIGASIGLVPFPRHGATLGEILSAADSACYAAKEAGRNRVQTYRVGDAELDRRRHEMQWVSRLQDAIAGDRLSLCMQPIAATSDGLERRRQRFELLLRMTDESGATVLPGAFLPAAERYNFVSHLDRWVVDRAFNWLRNPGADFGDIEMCFINLSGHTVTDPDFHRFVVERLTANNVNPENVCFEITETAAIGNLAAATKLMCSLGGLGCHFALDDFGSGLCSFSYLKNLPVDFIKIDGAFVRGIARDCVDRTMVRSINDVARAMAKQTVAEFVETDNVLRAVSALGIDFAQGYAVGRPRPLPKIT